MHRTCLTTLISGIGLLLCLVTPVSAGTLYVVGKDSGAILQVDTETGLVSSTIPLPEPASDHDALAYAGDRLFYAAGTGTGAIYAIDLATGAVLYTLEPPLEVDILDGMAFTHGSLFLLDGQNNAIFRVDPEMGTVLHRCDTPTATSGGLAAGLGRMFVSLNMAPFVQAHMMMEVDPLTCHFIGSSFVLPIGYNRGMGFDGQRIYFSLGDFKIVRAMDVATHTMDDPAQIDMGETLTGATMMVPDATVNISPGSGTYLEGEDLEATVVVDADGHDVVDLQVTLDGVNVNTDRFECEYPRNGSTRVYCEDVLEHMLPYGIHDVAVIATLENDMMVSQKVTWELRREPDD